MKRFFQMMIAAVFVWICVGAVPAFAQEGEAGTLQMDLHPAGTEESLPLHSVIAKDGDAYFFLPSGVTEENMGEVLGEGEYQTMRSRNLCSIHFFSSDPEKKGRDFIHQSKDNKAPGIVYVCDENFSLIYKGKVSAIKGRGNATWYNTDKKAYQVKLDKKADLLDPVNGEQKAKKWILLTNAYDPTLIRNNLIYAFSKEIGLENSPDGEAVDLYYDGDYRGSYYLCEKVEIGDNRVEIDDLEKDVEEANPDTDFDALEEVMSENSLGNEVKFEKDITDPEEISGGYLLEIDSAHYQTEKNWFLFNPGERIVCRSPEYISESMMEYISTAFSGMYEYISGQAADLGSGENLPEYIDMDSFARYFIVGELMDVQDAWVSSTYLYKPRNEDRFYAGPIWDADSSMRLRFENKTPRGWLRGQTSRILLQLPEFRKAVQEIYISDVRPVMYDTLLGEKEGKYLKPAEAIRDEVAASVAMNYMIWDINDNGGNFHPKDTVEANYEDIMNWMPERVKWLDSVMMDEHFAENRVVIGKPSGCTATLSDSKEVCTIAFEPAVCSVSNIFNSRTENASDYEVAYRDAETDSWTDVSTSGAAECTISGLQEGKTYECKIRARYRYNDTDYEGEYGDVITITVPGPAQDPSQDDSSKQDPSQDDPSQQDPPQNDPPQQDPPQPQPDDVTETGANEDSGSVMPEEPAQAGDTFRVKSSTYRIITVASAKAGTAGLVLAGNAKKVSVPAKVRYKGKTYKVTEIGTNAFRKCGAKKVALGKNVRTIRSRAFNKSAVKVLTIKSARLTKKSVKGSLKGSKVKTIRVKVGSSKKNLKTSKKYKRIFGKKNSGRKVVVR